MSSSETSSGVPDHGDAIAIIGMAGRFPGAPSVKAFWRNLRAGVESISFFRDDELLAAGIDPELLHSPNYVKAGGVLEDVELFDATFFGYHPREAELMDPQQRALLECAWEALENAGYVPDRHAGSVGVFAGASMNTYVLNNLLRSRSFVKSVAGLEMLLGSDKDFLSTRLSYKLNLRGPSITVQTACSTSLVAVAQACQSLLHYQCDMALAGGVSISVPTRSGSIFTEGGVTSPDGHCRAFDAKAQGMVAGNGAAMIVLKRLGDALEDGDSIDAVILGTAVNNDGSLKVGYTAPSVEGQAEVVAMAQAVADVSPDTISYLEAHGTGTELGDPIEIAALTQAFRQGTDRNGFCALGAVKSNVGHLDSAAGVTGLIKTVLSLQHQEIPPSLHFETPNPNIDFENSPFFVNAELRPWQPQGDKRRAGVSSFGMGGTNAHVVLEEGLESPTDSSTRPSELLLLSARTESALQEAAERLATELEEESALSLEDVAYTLAVGRKAFPRRRALVASSLEEAIQRLRKPDRLHCRSGKELGDESKVAFLFSGQGSQYGGMATALANQLPEFRNTVDSCCETLERVLGHDLRPWILATRDEFEVADQALAQTQYTQPALFVVEYALAKSWETFGIQPAAMLGHSIGEYVAATLAGVFSVDDALRLVALRGKLMQSMPEGDMLAVSLSEADIRQELPAGVDVAALNETSMTVVAGPAPAIASLEQSLRSRSIASRRLHTSHAFHSSMMEPILDEFASAVAKTQRHAPQIPFLSNVTGDWITAEQANDPQYWANHLRQAVRYTDGVAKLFTECETLLEVGPGTTLSSLATRHPQWPEDRAALASLPHPRERDRGFEFFQLALGELWARGLGTPERLYENERRQRVHLPSYPFQRQRFWIDPPTTKTEASPSQRLSADQWLSTLTWKPAPLSPTGSVGSQGRWLVFEDARGVATKLTDHLTSQGHTVVSVVAGSKYEASDSRITLRPGDPDDHRQLWAWLREQGIPDRVVHCFSCDESDWERGLDLAYYDLVETARGLGDASAEVLVVSCELHPQEGKRIAPWRSTLLGPCRIAPQEFPQQRWRSVDIGAPDHASAERILAEFQANEPLRTAALRQSERLVPQFESLASEAKSETLPLRKGGVYWVTGGSGGIGSTFGSYLVQEWDARVVLISRSIDEAAHGNQNLLRLAGDVASRSDMKRALDETQRRFGAVQGVIHAAGLADGALLLNRDRAASEQVLRPKVHGAQVLTEVLSEQPLEFLVLCSSLAATLPQLGQVSYCAANAFLDAFAADCRSRGIPAVSVQWDAWKEVGMAAKSRDVNAPPSTPSPTTMTEVDHPLFLTRHSEPGREVLLSSFRLESPWIFQEHQVDGQAVMPGTGYLEMVRAAFQSLQNAPLEMEAVQLLSPMVITAETPREVRTVIEKSGPEWRFQVESRADGESWIAHAEGLLRPYEPANTPPLPIPESGEATLSTKGDAGGPVTCGPRWDNVRWHRNQGNDGWAALELPSEFAADLPTFGLHPAMMDTATTVGYRSHKGDGDYFPWRYGKLRAYGSLPSRVFSHTRFRPQSSDADSLSFDVSIFAEDGQPLVEIEDYVLRRRQDRRASHAADQDTVENLRLSLDSFGSLDRLRLVKAPRSAPEPDQVEIEVQAAGLNFKDVLRALGAMGGTDASALPFGMECAGVVTRVGSQVSSAQVGDAVYALGTSCFQPFALLPASTVAKKPESLSFVEAASLPAAFFTAYYSLVTVGRLQAKERVLIHAATGGVGMAAVKIAQWCGAEIFATAGSDQKREFLRSMGIAHVMDSRAQDFVEQIADATQGNGVDVVLNSLAGESLKNSVKCLAPFGRFLEIGLRDIQADMPLGLKPFERSLSFHAIMIRPDMPGYEQSWQEMSALFEKGEFSPLPIQEFAADQWQEAFEFMAGASHIGKLVIPLHGKKLLDQPRLPRGSRQGVPHRPRPSANNPAARLGKQVMERGLSNAEGIDVLKQVLCGNQALVMVSTTSLPARLDRVRSLTTTSVTESPDDAAGNVYERPELSNDYLAPRNDAEQRIAQLWQELLGLKQVGVRDNFFELGGHSLLAMQLLAKLREALSVELSMDDFFESPTIEGMTAAVEEDGQKNTEDTAAVDEVLRMVGDLSDEDVLKLLDGEGDDD